MSRSVVLTALVLMLFGILVFLYKTVALEMPIQPDRSARVWRVELSALVRGEDRGTGKVSLVIPRSDPGQVVLDEQTADDGLDFEVVESGGVREATWRGRLGDFHRLVYTFRVHVPRDTRRARSRSPADAPDGRGRRQERRVSTPAPIRNLLEDLSIPENEDPASVVATVFGFVSAEVESVIGGSEDALLTLQSREGSEIGRSRLMVSMLRTAGLEAHLTTGIRLGGLRESRWVHYADVLVDDHWVPLFPWADSPGEGPANLVVLARGDRPMLRTLNATASSPQVRILRESLQPAELAAFMAPPSELWRAASLYALPLETQDALRVLLVMPVAALIAAVYRNLIGLRTFGTFMPILIALSLRRTDVLSGGLLVTSVLIAGVLWRLLLDRLRLLFVPRICLLLCLVILNLTGISIAARVVGGNDLAMTGLLFPIVILSMLIERVSVTTLEEGYLSTLKLLMGSLGLSLLVYPIFRSDLVAHLFFGFPELVFCVMALLVLIGGYSGYRLSELWRFRSLMPSEQEDLAR